MGTANDRKKTQKRSCEFLVIENSLKKGGWRGR